MLESFLTIKEDTLDELTEKKSRFIAYVFRIKNEEDANIKIEMIKKKNRDARHNVFAYRLENGHERYSDDGEPSRNGWRANFGYFAWRKIGKCINCGN